MAIFVSVGTKVVGAFESRQSPAAIRCLSMLAPGCKPKIKKAPPSTHFVYVSKQGQSASNEARQTTNRVGSYKSYPRMLKPGDFSL